MHVYETEICLECDSINIGGEWLPVGSDVFDFVMKIKEPCTVVQCPQCQEKEGKKCETIFAFIAHKEIVAQIAKSSW